jgi:hypothetical protein
MHTRSVEPNMRILSTLNGNVLRLLRGSIDASCWILPARKLYAFGDLRDAYRDSNVQKNAAFWMSHIWNILIPTTLTEAMVCHLLFAKMVTRASPSKLHPPNLNQSRRRQNREVFSFF